MFAIVDPLERVVRLGLRLEPVSHGISLVQNVSLFYSEAAHSNAPIVSLPLPIANVDRRGWNTISVRVR